MASSAEFWVHAEQEFKWSSSPYISILDCEIVEYLLMGMCVGFCISFVSSLMRLQSTRRNMQFTEEEPAVVEAYLAKEWVAGRVVDPLPADDLEAGESIHITRLGVIPKLNQPGKWRLIVHMSHPKGASINDGVRAELCSLTYACMNVASAMVLQKGEGMLLAKLNIHSQRLMYRSS